MSSVENRNALIAAHHADASYFKGAETEEWTSMFWRDGSLFKDLFARLDLTNIVELACGHGRHSAQIVDRAGHIILVDAQPTNIDVCRERFANRKNVSCIANSGSDLKDIPSESQTSVFSYDAMVHFEPQDVIAYIDEIARILKPGGQALLHYSNTYTNFRSYRDSESWRNFFSEQMMRAFSWRAGLFFVASYTMDWFKDSDALTLLRKGS